MMDRFPSPPGEQAPTGAATGPAYTASAMVDERGMVTGWSEGARRLLGYVSSQVVGHPAARLLAEGIADAGEGVWRGAAGGRRWSGTVVLRHRDGRRLERRLLAHRRRPGGRHTEWLVVSAVAGEPDPPAGDAGSLTAEGLGEWVFRQSPSLLAVFDTGLRLVRANAGMQRALSLSEEEMRGLRLPEIAPDPVSDQAEAAMRLVVAGNEVQEMEACVGPAGVGAEYGWPASLAPLKDAGGRVRAVCLSAHHPLPGQLAGQRMQWLDEAKTRIGTTSDVQRTAQELTDVAVPRLADFAAVDLLPDVPRRGDDEPSVPAAVPLTLRRTAVASVVGAGPEVGESLRYPALSPVTRCVAEGRGAVYGAGDPAVAAWAEQDRQAVWLRESEVHSVMVVPVRGQDGVTLGTALLGRHRRREPFDAGDLAAAEELTFRAGVAMHAARRPAREHTTTMTLQRSLLPQTLPDQQALDIATRYLPAGGRAGVGGDWFDVIPLSGTRVALVVGDVVGHGIRASATMGRVRTAVRTLADVDLPPDELLTHLDDLVIHLSAEESGAEGAAESAGGIGTTCLYAVYDPVSRGLSLARAGHPPPAVVTPDGAVRFLDVPPGPPLGLGGLPFETFETELPAGSLLALYTDGLLAAREHDIDEALDQMFQALARPAGTLDAVCDRILTSMLAHRPDDDIALLVARTRSLDSGRVATWDVAFDPSAVARARQQATEQLTAWQLDEASFITELVVSELVTNAIRYGRPPVRLRLIHAGTTLICEVYDSAGTAPHMRRARVFDEGGRGLLLVGQLAQRWGSRHTIAGKTVWAEQFLEPD
ncbi:SpoIIE family protein phosphatase [Streptomyces sp. HUCO-GS316]|uniref:SpoIIE family protein phosphatase n=1 Tax=Streptomyces sp. HUCO-GS316 TaxID=2692198 RepID=UPI001371CA0B|nr:SpoIIE family protein phosphatase [Streptomyces sp. HUCO-GS316]